ncbi:hypothetical protein PV332_10625 [Streptomyces scabiei]|nr:hypothetical protein [Streptomyces scabiei]MDX2575935.1 hypothetical protein [Streptomyces scabiei]MDX2885592.1 hypothetical protein [Streptomyces scabiei]MDX3143891.1 hypothetical protein [Streptomyces scabiei]
MDAQCAPYRQKLNPAPYATIIPDRKPAVKYHAGSGLAKLAVGYIGRYWSTVRQSWIDVVRGGEIYKRTADGWELLYRVEQGTPADELPWKERTCSE